jgi:acetolactate synthase-1/2/3 large subunit
VRDPAALESAIRTALERNAPELIEVECGDMASPWPHIIKPPIGMVH